MTELDPRHELNFGDMTLRRIGAHNGVPHTTQWLVDGLILYGGTSMLSGMPKTGKTWLMLDLAISVAAQKPFLGNIDVSSGPVMIYSPEGPTSELIHRIRQICIRRTLDPESLDLYLIEKRQLFLDSEVDQDTIRSSIEKVRPCFVVFDPMAECFNGDENRSDDVKIMSRFLNSVAHEFNTTIMLTHHSTKDGASMRGSGALRAYGDSYLYLEKSKSGKITLTNEQRHGTPAAPIYLELKTVDGNTAYEMVCQESNEPKLKDDPTNKILALLKVAGSPMSQRDLRMKLGGSNGAYPGYLKELKDANLVEKVKDGWQIKVMNGGPKSKTDRTGKETDRTNPEKPVKSFIQKIFGGGKG